MGRKPSLLNQVKAKKLMKGKTLQIFEIIVKGSGVTSWDITQKFNRKNKESKTAQNIVAGRLSELKARGFIYSEGFKAGTPRKSVLWWPNAELPDADVVSQEAKQRVMEKIQERELPAHLSEDVGVLVASTESPYAGTSFETNLMVASDSTVKQSFWQRVRNFFN